MRLIDADKIDFEKIFVGNADLAKDIRDTAQEYIDAQPTAYDVDKVVEQIKCNSQNIALLYPDDQGGDYEYADGIEVNRAEEIVRAGIKV